MAVQRNAKQEVLSLVDKLKQRAGSLLGNTANSAVKWATTPGTNPLYDSYQATQQLASQGNVPARYVQNQIVNPVVEGVRSVTAPKSTIPQRAMGALQTAGGAFSATPIGIGYSALYGGIAGGLQAKRENKPIGKSVIKGITQPTSIGREGLGIQNPFISLGVDLLAGNPRGALKSAKNIKNFSQIVRKPAINATVFDEAVTTWKQGGGTIRDMDNAVTAIRQVGLRVLGQDKVKQILRRKGGIDGLIDQIQVKLSKRTNYYEGQGYMKGIVDKNAPKDLNKPLAEEARGITELKGKVTNELALGRTRDVTKGSVNFKDLKVLPNGLEEAQNSFKKYGSKVDISKKPIVVGVDINTGEKQLLDGYHRYVANNGAGETKALFVPMKNGDIIDFKDIKLSSPLEGGVKSPQGVKPVSPLSPSQQQAAKKLPGVMLTTDKKMAEGKGSVIADIQQGFKGGRDAIRQAEKVQKGSFLQQVRTQTIDRLTPVYDLVKQATKELPSELNPYKRLRLLAGTSGKVEAKLQQGLSPILQKEKDRLDDLSSLLVLERESELTLRGLKRARTQEQIAQGIEELKAKYGDEGFATLTQSAQGVRNFGSQLLDELHSAGIISKEAYSGIKSRNQFYVPFEIAEHIADNLEKGNFVRSSYNVASQDVIKAIGSTTKNVGDPLEALVRKTAKVTALVEKNKAMQALVNLRNIDKVFKDIIKPVKGAVSKDSGTINVFENGKNVTYEVPQVIENVIKNLDAETSNILVKIHTPFAKLLRAGATGLNIGFIPANIVRDVADAVTTEAGERGIRGVTSLLKAYPAAIFSAITKGDLYQKWLAAGGAQSTLTEQVFKGANKTVQELAGKRSIVKTLLKSPKSLVEFANRVGEQSTRIARFQAGLKTGENITEAAFKSRDITLDFAKAGNKVKVLNQIIPFLNAGIQGSEKLLRFYKNNPLKATLYTTMLFGVPSALLYSHNNQFEDFKDIPISERETNWIILARDRTPEEKENGDPIVGLKIPKGFIGRPVANITESVLDFAKQNDPQAFGNFLADTVESISPVGLPIDRQRLSKTVSQVLPPPEQVAIEAVTNRDLFFDRPIVPRKFENVKPREQYTDRTSPIAKTVGGALNISPLMIDNTISGLSAGLGRQASQLVSGDIKGATVDQITRRFSGVRGGREQDKEFEEVKKYQTEDATARIQKQRAMDTLLKQMKPMSTQERVELFKSIPDKKFRKDLLEKIEENQLGLTPAERSLKTVSVKQRTVYVKNQLKGKTTQEKIQIYKELTKKKIITKEVRKELFNTQ